MRAFGAVVMAVVVVLTGTAAGASTVVVGDSLTHQTYESSGWVVDAARGRALAKSRPLVAHHASLGPDALVVALGSNDVARRSGSIRPDVFFAARQPVDCVVLTTVRVNGVTPFYNKQWRRYARRWNRAVFATGVPVAHWNKAQRGHPEWFLADGLHLSRAGEVAYDRLLRDTVAVDCGEQP